MTAWTLAIVACLLLSASVRAELLIVPLDQDDPNDAVTLLDLLDGTVDGVSVGDKIFTDFLYSTLPNDDMPLPQDVNVLGFEDLDGNFGISFHGVFQDLPGDNKPSDALIRFTVDISPDFLEQGYRISDAHLFIGGVGVGENSYLTVDESFQGVNSTLNAYATTLGGQLNQVLSDEVIFDQVYTRLRVSKDILAFANAEADLPARTTVVDQSFSQIIIPEPTTFMIGAVCGVSILVTRKRSLLAADKEDSDTNT